MQTLDELDWQILRFLRADGRTAFREIARQVGVTEGTVRNRVNALTDSGTIRIIAVADPISLGVPILATTYARIRPASLEQFCQQVEADPCVCYLGVGLGTKNVVLESMHQDLASLFAFTERYLNQPEVHEYETVQVMTIRKTVWDWEVARPAPTPDNLPPAEASPLSPRHLSPIPSPTPFSPNHLPNPLEVKS